MASTTPGATIAPVGQPSRQRRHDSAAVGDRFADRVLGGRDDRAEHEKAAGAGQQDVGVLAEPAETAEVGDLAVDDRVVVGECDRTVVGSLDPGDDRAQPGAQWGVVIDPRVSGDPSLGAGRSFGFVDGPIRSGGDDDAASLFDRPLRVGRAFRVPVGEAHVGVQPGIATFEQCGACPFEHVGRGDAEALDSVLGRDRLDLVPGRKR